MTGDTGKRALLVAGWLLGAVGGAAASLGLFMVDGTCPQWEDEGISAAPSSPYVRIMCSPTTQEPPFVLVVPLVAVVALAALTWWLGRLPRTWPRAATATLALALVPALLVGLLHVTLPKGPPTSRETAHFAQRY